MGNFITHYISFLNLKLYLSIDEHLNSIFQFQRITIKTSMAVHLVLNFFRLLETANTIFIQVFKPIYIFLNEFSFRPAC